LSSRASGVLYLDSSAIVKRAVREPETAALETVPGMRLDTARRSLELFAERVLPALRPIQDVQKTRPLL
jgi:predicted nucleic acid-binding protein